MKILITMLLVGMLAGGSFSTKMQVGQYGAEYTSSISG